jgi:orotate phosphoribosyltransferase
MKPTNQNTNQEISQRVADLLLSINAVTFRFDPPYTFTSGIKSPIYLDNRLIISYPKVRKEIISFYVDLIKKTIDTATIDCLSATATAAIPHGAWIAEKLKIPMVFCRSSKKEHGKGNQIEGVIRKGDTVIIIEDHISTSGSAVGNAEAIRALGGKVKHIFATTTYETQKATEELKTHRLQLRTLSTGKIIVAQAYKKGILTKKEHEIVLDWFKDPAGWGKKFSIKSV